MLDVPCSATALDVETESAWSAASKLWSLRIMAIQQPTLLTVWARVRELLRSRNRSRIGGHLGRVCLPRREQSNNSCGTADFVMVLMGDAPNCSFTQFRLWVCLENQTSHHQHNRPSSLPCSCGTRAFLFHTHPARATTSWTTKKKRMDLL